jgi:succinoglycan biosynthesis protein ExoA
MNPTVSVVVPCLNEKGHIETCIESILCQQLPGGDLEVIVVDGMSEDGTREILMRMGEQDTRLRMVDNPSGTTPSGINAGIKAARGQYIAILGAHNRYASDYLRHSVDVLEETGADNVGGSMLIEAHSLVEHAISAAHTSAFSVGGARWHNPNYEGPADTVFGGMYRRDVFDRIGFFDEELVRNQDDELNLRLTRAGGTVWQSPRIRSWYSPRGSLRALFRQYVQYGYWKVRVIQKHRWPASVRHLFPACFVLSLTLLLLSSLRWPAALWGLLGLIGTYSTCNVIASVLAARHKGWKVITLLPLVFACYHFAYGLGFLRGIYDFVILRRGPAIGFSKLTRHSASS